MDGLKIKIGFLAMAIGLNSKTTTTLSKQRNRK
jgi:hypothetical protein